MTYRIHRKERTEREKDDRRDRIDRRNENNTINTQERKRQEEEKKRQAEAEEKRKKRELTEKLRREIWAPKVENLNASNVIFGNYNYNSGLFTGDNDIREIIHRGRAKKMGFERFKDKGFEGGTKPMVIQEGVFEGVRY